MFAATTIQSIKEFINTVMIYHYAINVIVTLVIVVVTLILVAIIKIRESRSK